MSKADMQKRPEEVSRMFDEVAETYDRTNDILSLGQSKLWRKSVRNLINPQSGQRILDLAAGTGTSSMALLGDGVQVVAADFSKGMLEVGKKRHPELEFAFADATKLPFKDKEFDAVTISFGIRNVENVDKALSEMFRVTKPGGVIVVCEFSHPKGLFGWLYKFYLRRVLPTVAKLVAKNPDAYSYLGESIEAWPKQMDFASQIENSGFENVGFKNLSLGIVAVHYGEKS
ncbi:MAG: bifunctional demethylmenaquinone methyltransferase/2-methoxy-6-polyprenyl-1,4-benzoquinol methylase UbiE [Microbacteriaceae bacterium]|nr:bifunctional demethylmenaquinone methyltransferase/2-methoxy-6-polyprenyl-1,4-benzoquinol methylase UbiE [Microbacteriaceae bacterium]MDR9443987.1 bifunctional demethylmenaquinone methyltransferase/2-methoxy-6-polyprenyl-1,4-benzoquinol methylase UbiE [Microbacteriaceae bacterium]